MITNEDWIQPEFNKDYAEWAEHNHTAIVPAKVRKPKYKSSVENSVGILEKGLFHDLEESQYFSLEQFNSDLQKKLDELNHENFKNKEHSRCYYWEEEKSELMSLPSVPYEYMERKEAKVNRICEKALMYAFQEQTRLVDDYMVRYVTEHELING